MLALLWYLNVLERNLVNLLLKIIIKTMQRKKEIISSEIGLEMLMLYLAPKMEVTYIAISIRTSTPCNFSKIQCSYRYSDKYLANWIKTLLIAIRIRTSTLCNFSKIQCSYRDNDKNNRCLLKLTNIHSSYCYNNK